ncbi:unnamed protein product [Closterium sp. NIES-54]
MQTVGLHQQVQLVALLVRPSLRGVPPPPLPPPTPLLLLLTSLVLRMSGLLLLVGSAATARARVAGVVAVAAGVVVGAAVEVVEAVEVVVVVGVVPGVGALVAAVVAAVGVAVVAAMGMVAVGLELLSGEVLAVDRGSSSSVGARPRRPSSFTCGKPRTQHYCFSRLDDAWRAEFGDEAEHPRWAELLRSGIAIFDLDYASILTAMYALSVSAEGDCYLCVSPDPGIEGAALGANEPALPGSVPTEALHTFTLDSGASHYFFRDSTTLTPLSAPVPVRLADQSGGPTLARSFTVLPCPAVSPSNSVAPPCSYCLLSHQTLLRHHRLGHPSLPRFRGMHSRLLISGLPRSLPTLPPLPAPPCLPCVEGRQRAAPHSSSFPPRTAPLQTLHMDVWGPARVSRQGRERYFLLVVDEYSRYTMVFPLHSKGEVPDVLIPWIRAVRLQLREQFRQDLPVLRLHSDRGGEFSSNLLWDFFMEFAHTSMIHAAAPHFLLSLAVGDASVFRVWGSHAFVRDSSADKLCARAIPYVFLGFPLDVPGWQVYHPTSRRVFPSQDLMFDESVPFYRLFTYRSAPPPPPPLFLAPYPLLVDPLPAEGPAPSGVSQVDPLPAEPGGAEPEGAGSKGARSRGAEPVGAEPEGVELGDAESEGAESGGAEPQGTASSGGPAGATPRLSPRPEPLSPQEMSGGAVSGGTGAGGNVQPIPFFVPLLRHVLSLPSSCGLPPSSLSLPPHHSQPRLQPDSPLPAPSPYTARTDSFIERREPASRPASLVRLVRTNRRVPRLCPPIPGTYAMALRPSSIPLRVPLPPPLGSSLPTVANPTPDLARAASPTISRVLASVVTDPSFESTVASALVAELVDIAIACRLDYATALVAESESANSPSVAGECALGTGIHEDRQEDLECLAVAVPHLVAMLLALEGDPDAPDIPTPRSYTEAITGPYSSLWQTAMDAEMASWKSTGTYVDAVPSSRANIVGACVFSG